MVRPKIVDELETPLCLVACTSNVADHNKFEIYCCLDLSCFGSIPMDYFHLG